MARRTRTTKVKSVRFMRAHGTTITNRQNPEWVYAMGSPDKRSDWHVIPTDMLRYDMAFVNDADPTLIAFPLLSSGYGGTITRGRWDSFDIQLRGVEHAPNVGEGERFIESRLQEEHWNRCDLYEQQASVEAGSGWYTFRRHRDGLLRVPLSAFLAAHPNDNINEVTEKYAQQQPYIGA